MQPGGLNPLRDNTKHLTPIQGENLNQGTWRTNPFFVWQEVFPHTTLKRRQNSENFQGKLVFTEKFAPWEHQFHFKKDTCNSDYLGTKTCYSGGGAQHLLTVFPIREQENAEYNLTSRK